MGVSTAPRRRAVVFTRGAREARSLELSEGDLVLPGPPRQLRGRRALHVSDAHLSPPLSLAPRIVALARAARPDWIFVTGDMSRGRVGLTIATQCLSELAGVAPTWAVSGNADYLSRQAPELPRAVFGKARGLQNEAELLVDGDPPCWVAGVSDPFTGRDNLERALGGVPAGAWVLLLAHSPDIIMKPLSRRAALVLSGHTHGGQVCLPGFGPLWARTGVSRRYASGAHRLGNTTLVVSRGAGTTRLPLRVFCPAELTVWRLAPAS